MTTAGTVGESEDGFTPLSVEEALALVNEATGVDRAALLAERAEAEAQLRAAEATLGVPPVNGNGSGKAEQEREEPAQKPHNVEVQNGSVAELDVEALQAAAARALQADDAVAQAASEASGRPPAPEPVAGTSESAFARMMEIREELPATWRRLVGAMISATGMAIVIGALGWKVYWLLVPIALILIMTVDLQLAGKSLREASAQASGQLSGGDGGDELDRIRAHRTRMEEAEARLTVARAERETAYSLFAELAPGRHPSEIDEIISEYEAERAARAAEAERQAQAEAERAQAERAQAEQTEAERAEPERAQAEQTEAERAQAEAEAEPEAQAEAVQRDAQGPETERAADEAGAERAEPGQIEAPEPEPVGATTASEWWFGTKEAPEAPAAAAAPVRALAERLSTEGREALARIQAKLDALDRVELAKKSLEWHEANGSADPERSEGSAAEMPPEKP
ncbi:MAG TPA: hypothetical protein VEG38_20305 [Acidimicrobiia bacterium]|nr:hypothetical protein [Acidimicrobiia bacterium]